MLRTGREFAAGKMQVDLLAAESDCLAPIAERDRRHSQNALVKGAGLLDAGHGQNKVIDGVDVHYRASMYFQSLGCALATEDRLRIGLAGAWVRLILVGSPDVQSCQRDLQRDKRISVVVPGPDNPQHVA